MKFEYTLYLYCCQRRVWYPTCSFNNGEDALYVMRKHPIAKVVYVKQTPR